MTDAETIRFYDAAAAGMEGLEMGETPPVLAGFMARLPPGGAVLDLGCGAGRATAQLARAGFDVTGLDASAELLAVASRLAPAARFVHAGFDGLDEEAAYAGVWAQFALLHAPRAELPRHLAAIARALVPGGHFYLSMLTGAGEFRDAQGRAYSYYTPEELRRLTEAAGFDEIAAETGETTAPEGGRAPFLALTMRRGR